MDADSSGEDWKIRFRSDDGERAPNPACPDRFAEEAVRPEQQPRSKWRDGCAIWSTLDGKKRILARAGSMGTSFAKLNCQRQTKYRSTGALLQTGKCTSVDQQPSPDQSYHASADCCDHGGPLDQDSPRKFHVVIEELQFSSRRRPCIRADEIFMIADL